MKQKTLFADVLETVTKYFLVLVILVVIGIFLSGLRVVETGNVAVVLRFGKLVGDNYEEQVQEPGLMFAFPYIIDEVIMVPTGRVMEQKVTTYYTDPNEATTLDGGYVITGDQNIAVVAASVKYVISDPVAYALYVKDISAVINTSVSTAMLNEAARVNVDNLLTDGKDAYAKSVLKRAQEKLAVMGAGVTLTTVELTNVSMPEEVRDVYEAVNSATVQATTTVERANQYKAGLLLEADSEATTLVAEANAEFSRKIAVANTELAEFWGVLDEYEQRPDVVKTRIYSAKSIAFMQKLKKVYVVQDGDNKIFINP